MNLSECPFCSPESGLPKAMPQPESLCAPAYGGRGRRRVIQVVPCLQLGGTEKVAQLFAMHLNPERFEVLVWSPADGPRGEQLRAQHITVIIGGALHQVVRGFRPHIVHVHRAGWPDAPLMRTLRAGLWGQDAAGHPLPRVVETNVFGRMDDSPTGRSIDTTLFVSHFCARRFAVVHGVEVCLPRYGVLYNPVDVDFLAQHVLAPSERDYARPVIGRISRADPGKWSMAFGLDMLPQLQERLPHIKYRVVGGTPQARQRVAELRLEHAVQFLPELKTEAELATFFDSVSVLAHANDTGESFGLVIAEAMAAGLPVVTHPSWERRDNAQLELVEHGVTGLVAGTPEIYAQAVAWLIDHPEDARRMGTAGQRKAAQLFAAPTVARQLEGVYDMLCPLQVLAGDMQGIR